MVLGGLWHGAAWTFVLWGVYHGLLLIAYRRPNGYRDRARGCSARRRRRTSSAGWSCSTLTCLGWLIFRARSAAQLARLLRSLVVDFAPAIVNVHGLLIPLVLYTDAAAPRARLRGVVRRRAGRAEAADRRAILCLRRHVLPHHAVR